MALYASLREFHVEPDKDDLRGVDVYDGSQTERLGTIHDIVVDLDDGKIEFIVVSNGEREVLLPSERLHLWGEDVVVDLSRADFASLPSFDHSVMKDAEAWDDYQDRFNEAWAKIGKPQSSKPLEIGRQEMESTLWEWFSPTVRRKLLEDLRREGEIAAQRKTYPRP